MSRVPLAVLDLVPIVSGSDAREALGNALDLVRRTEAAGYGRYWFAQHHFTPGVLGSSPAVQIALAGSVSSRIRLGSAAVQLGAHTREALVAEEFALLDAAFPGRIDLGIGRSGLSRSDLAAPTAPDPVPYVTAEGLSVPAGFSFETLRDLPKFRTIGALLRPTNTEADAVTFADQVQTVLDLLDTGAGEGPARVQIAGFAHSPTRPEVWLFGSGTYTAAIAGRHGLRFAANYHSAPSGVIAAVEAYRSSFTPSSYLDQPSVIVSADVVVAETAERAAELASGYAAWVRSIRRGEGAIRYPSPAEAAALEWTDEDRALVVDRVETQFVGTAASVADQLRVLQQATGADELLVTTITHEHADRVRSYELLAAEWAARQENVE